MPFIPLRASSLRLSHPKKWLPHKTLRHADLAPKDDYGLIVDEECPSRYPSYYRDSDSKNISSIPVELLREIFLLALGSQVDEFREYIEMNYPPFNLSHTCRLWRDLATNTPLLWNVIVVPPSITPQLLQLYVDRSQNLSLAVYFHLFGGFRPCPPKRNREAAILDVLHSCAPRWEELYVHVAYPEEHGSFLELPPQSFSSLRRVHWSATPGYPEGSFERFWELAQEIPTIEDALFYRVPQKGPWSQLTQLHFVSKESSTIPSYISVLRQCNNLAVLHWVFFAGWNDQGVLPAASPALVPQLTDLRMWAMKQGDVFLKSLILPSIRRICWDTHPRLEVLSSMEDLLARSGVTLDALQISSFSSDDIGHLVQSLRKPCFEALRLLSVGTIHPMDALWEAIKDASFLPGLCSLRWPVGSPPQLLVPRSALKERLAYTTLQEVGLLLSCSPVSGCEVTCTCTELGRVASSQLSDLVQVRTWKRQESGSADIVQDNRNRARTFYFL